MILFLIDFLKEYAGIKTPAVFSYFSTRMMLAALTSLLLSIFLGPYFIRKLYEMNCHIATDRATESRFSNYPIQSWMLFKSHKSLGYFSPESIVLYDSQ